MTNERDQQPESRPQNLGEAIVQVHSDLTNIRDSIDDVLIWAIESGRISRDSEEAKKLLQLSSAIGIIQGDILRDPEARRLIGQVPAEETIGEGLVVPPAEDIPGAFEPAGDADLGQTVAPDVETPHEAAPVEEPVVAVKAEESQKSLEQRFQEQLERFLQGPDGVLVSSGKATFTLPEIAAIVGDEPDMVLMSLNAFLKRKNVFDLDQMKKAVELYFLELERGNFSVRELAGTLNDEDPEFAEEYPSFLQEVASQFDLPQVWFGGPYLKNKDAKYVLGIARVRRIEEKRKPRD